MIYDEDKRGERGGERITPKMQAKKIGKHVRKRKGKIEKLKKIMRRSLET
jgi:hypothetical protein